MSEAIRKLYDEVFVSAEAVVKWVAEGNGESEILEYKENPDIEKKKSQQPENVQRQLAKEATAFANSEGGIIIWGVRQKNSADAPVVEMLEYADKFCSRLTQLTGGMASPPIIGVAHKPLTTEKGDGFVITFIPQSNDRPHMAGGGESRYFVRSGESAVKMGHHQVRDAFVAKSLPDVRLFLSETTVSDHPKTGLLFELRNFGVVSAENYRVEVVKSVRILVKSFQRLEGVARDRIENHKECVCLYPPDRLSDLAPSEILSLKCFAAGEGDGIHNLRIELQITIISKSYYAMFKIYVTPKKVADILNSNKPGFIECPQVNSSDLDRFLRERIEIPFNSF